MAYLTASDLLAAAAGQTIDFDAPGLGMIKVRSLTVLEYSEVEKTPDPLHKIAQTISIGMVDPHVSIDDLLAMRIGAIELLTPIAVRINELSAMGDSEALENFRGGGS